MKNGEIFNPYNLFVGAHIPNSVLRRTDISSTAKLVFARLCQYAGQNGECYPSLETLGIEIGKSTSHIQRAIQELIGVGLVERESPTGADRLSHKTTRYLFRWDESFLSSLKNTTRISGDNGIPGSPRRDSKGSPRRDSNERESLKRESEESAEAQISPNSQTEAESPDLAEEEDSNRLASMEGTIEDRIKFARKARGEKLTKRANAEETSEKDKKRGSKAFNIAKIYSEEFAKKWPDVDMPKWTSKEWAQAKSLSAKVGDDMAAKLIRKIFMEWDALSQMWKVRGYPTIAVILGYGASLVTEIATGKVVGAKNKAERKRVGEFNKEATAGDSW